MSRLVRAAIQASVFFAGFFVLLWPATALACPSCTTRSGGGYMIPLLLGGMILTPYLVTTVVLRIVRKAEAERAREDKAAAAASADARHSHVDRSPNAAPARA